MKNLIDDLNVDLVDLNVVNQFEKIVSTTTLKQAKKNGFILDSEKKEQEEIFQSYFQEGGGREGGS